MVIKRKINKNVYLDYTDQKKVQKPKKNYKKIFSGLKKGGSSFLRGFDKLAAGAEKSYYNLNLGENVMVTNGAYSGKTLKIIQIISGGIKGKLSNGEIINIRHGSYKK